jgi:short-subunit dehydrogenase
LITGASGGIGLQSAIGLAKQGANIVMVGRHKERTSEAVELVRTQTGNRSVSYCFVSGPVRQNREKS